MMKKTRGLTTRRGDRMTDLLRSAGEALYGPRWQTELARALGVSDRTVRRWVAGATPVPPEALTGLRRLCVRRARRLMELVRSSR